MRMIAVFLVHIGLLFTQTSLASNQAISPMNLAQANKLIELPLSCVQTEYPNKLNQVIGGVEDLRSPKELHPIFYGCFDWHSAVHGYWSMVSLLTQFPDLEKAQQVKNILQSTITADLVAQELAYFEKKINASWERTYGWAWLLKLSLALHQWQDPMASQLANNLQPLTQKIVQRYQEFLPKLIYPIRVGEHTNTDFGLVFALDYARALGDLELEQLIIQRANDFYSQDRRCPLKWEPSGYDFLSPCLQEVDLMRRVLPEKQFVRWLNRFMPNLKKRSFRLAVGQVGDRKDGKLVHLDGLNFSRAWVLLGLAKNHPRYQHLQQVAFQHINYSYPNLIGDSYEGGHWLGSFAIYALNQLNVEP